MEKNLESEICKRAELLKVSAAPEFAKGLTALIKRMGRETQEYGDRFGLQLTLVANFQLEVSERPIPISLETVKKRRRK